MPSPLFQQAGRAIQQACLAKFRQTTVGQVLTAVERATAGGRKMAQVDKMAERYGRQWQSRSVLKSMVPTELGRFMGELRKYSKGSTAGTQFLDAFLGQLGPAGKLLQGLFGAGKNLGTLNRDIETAAQLLEAFGWVTIPPGSYKPPAGGRVRPSGVEGMISTLENLGYKVIPPEAVTDKRKTRKEERKAERVTEGIEKAKARDTKTVVIDGVRYPKTHPIVTGETVLCPNSTNVYGFWYDAANQYLFVQFLQGDEEGTQGAGPVYRYSGVTRKEFIRFYMGRDRGNRSGGDSSPGTWVWEHLRVRGTVSGFRKPYRLAGIMGGYVPRAAMLSPEGEEYVPRHVRTKSGQYVSSSRPHVLVRPTRGPTTRKGGK